MHSRTCTMWKAECEGLSVTETNILLKRCKVAWALGFLVLCKRKHTFYPFIHSLASRLRPHQHQHLRQFPWSCSERLSAEAQPGPQDKVKKKHAAVRARGTESSQHINPLHPQRSFPLADLILPQRKLALMTSISERKWRINFMLLLLNPQTSSQPPPCLLSPSSSPHSPHFFQTFISSLHFYPQPQRKCLHYDVI